MAQNPESPGLTGHPAHSETPPDPTIRPKLKRRPRGLAIKLTRQKQERVDEAVRLITQLLPDHMIIQRIQEKFNVGRDTARLDTIAGHETFRRPPQDREARREELLSAYALHYATCMSKGAYVAAGNALRDLAKIEGIMTNTVIVRNPDGVPASQASTDQRDPKALKSRLEALLAKYRATLGQAAMDAKDDPELKPHYQSVHQEAAVAKLIKGEHGEDA